MSRRAVKLLLRNSRTSSTAKISRFGEIRYRIVRSSGDQGEWPNRKRHSGAYSGRWIVLP
jgi:hypothetical protein